MIWSFLKQAGSSDPKKKDEEKKEDKKKTSSSTGRTFLSSRKINRDWLRFYTLII